MFVSKNRQIKTCQKLNKNTVEKVEKDIFYQNRLTKNLYCFLKKYYNVFGDEIEGSQR